MLGRQQIRTARDVLEEHDGLIAQRLVLLKVLEMLGHPMSAPAQKKYRLKSYKSYINALRRNRIYLITFSTRIVAGELTTESLRLPSVRCCGGSSRGLLDAEVAIAKAAAAVDVLLLFRGLYARGLANVDLFVGTII